jgi:hypothetical protein
MVQGLTVNKLSFNRLLAKQKDSVRHEESNKDGKQKETKIKRNK